MASKFLQSLGFEPSEKAEKQIATDIGQESNRLASLRKEKDRSYVSLKTLRRQARATEAFLDELKKSKLKADEEKRVIYEKKLDDLRSALTQEKIRYKQLCRSIEQAERDVDSAEHMSRMLDTQAISIRQKIKTSKGLDASVSARASTQSLSETTKVLEARVEAMLARSNARRELGEEGLDIV